MECCECLVHCEKKGIDFRYSLDGFGLSLLSSVFSARGKREHPNEFRKFHFSKILKILDKKKGEKENGKSESSTFSHRDVEERHTLSFPSFPTSFHCRLLFLRRIFAQSAMAADSRWLPSPTTADIIQRSNTPYHIALQKRIEIKWFSLGHGR